MTKKTLLLGCAVLALSGMNTSTYAADTLILTNGDRITGELAPSSAEGMVTFMSHYGAEMNIPVNAVEAIQTEAGDVLSYAEASSVVAEDIAATEPAAGVEATKAPGAYEWSGRANLGAFIDDGNSNKKALTADAEVTARNEKNRWIAGVDANFANDEGVETENDQSLYGEYNRFVTDKWFYGVRQEFEKDKIAELDLRSKTGPFVGYQFYEQDDLNLKVRLGSNYVYEEYESGDTEEDATLAWGLNYDQTFFSDALTLFHNHTIDAPFDSFGDFLLESETGARVPVAHNLVGTAQVDFDWNNAPAPGIEEKDTKYSLKLGYEW